MVRSSSPTCAFDVRGNRLVPFTAINRGSDVKKKSSSLARTTLFSLESDTAAQDQRVHVGFVNVPRVVCAPERCVRAPRISLHCLTLLSRPRAITHPELHDVRYGVPIRRASFVVIVAVHIQK